MGSLRLKLAWSALREKLKVWAAHFWMNRMDPRRAVHPCAPHLFAALADLLGAYRQHLLREE
jgi:hypothetical protein